MNLSSHDPMFQKNMNDETSMLHDALLEPRHGVSEQYHVAVKTCRGES